MHLIFPAPLVLVGFLLCGSILLLSGCAQAEVAQRAPYAEAAPTPGAGDSLRIVSYNIRHGRGSDDRLDLERTASVLREFDADVIALQEVDDGVERSNRVDQPARLGEMLGMHHAFGSFFDYQGGRYGMAILSRCPLLSIDPVRLPDGNEPRVALAIEIERGGGTILTVVNVHFDWVEDDAFRFAQAREVARFLDALPGPYLILGDFNDEPGSRTLDLFQARALEASKPESSRFTFDSVNPRREIDFIFGAPAEAWTVGAVHVVDEEVASDHRPVVAEMVLRQGTVPGSDSCPAGP